MTREDWNRVDFTKRTCELAFELNRAETTICKHRVRLGINIRKQRWEGVDWSKSLQEIADERGVTTQAVRYQKKKWNSQTRK